jgi:hypothetical protein
MFNYQPGKSLAIAQTFVIGPAQNGITKSVGYFDDNNGVFLRATNGTYSFVIRSNRSGTPADSVYPQDSWNVDKFDGFGPSGVAIDFSKAQILLIDLEWLGVGRVRFGWNIGGKTYYAHYANHANIETGVYMSTPNLPLRAEISNSGSGPASSIETICSTVTSEGDIDTVGATRGPSPVAANTQTGYTTTTSVASALRLKSTHLGATINPFRISIFLTTTDSFMWSLQLNPTLASDISGSFTGIPNSAVEYYYGAVTPVTVTGEGYVLDSGIASNVAQVQSLQINTAIRPGAAIDGTRDILALCLFSFTGVLSCRSTISWVELL